MASNKEDIHDYSAQEVIAKLTLSPHPEKGWFIETFRDSTTVNNRSISTAIYYLLEGSDEWSYWHKVVDAAEIWHYYAGAPLQLDISQNDGTSPRETRILGANIFEDQQPHVVIEKDLWQKAKSLGNWTLVGTTVAPGFIESAFEMAPADWEPKDGK